MTVSESYYARISSAAYYKFDDDKAVAYLVKLNPKNLIDDRIGQGGE